MDGEKVEQRRVPDPYDPIYVRRHTGKFVGLKANAWADLKERRRGTTFFSDLAWARKNLLLAASILAPMAATPHPNDDDINIAIWEVHPLLKHSEIVKIYEQIVSEAEFMIELWHKYVSGAYKMPPAILKRYEKFQLKFRPDFSNIDLEHHYSPFMNREQRQEAVYKAKMKDLSGKKMIISDDPNVPSYARGILVDDEEEEIVLVDDDEA